MTTAKLNNALRPHVAEFVGVFTLVYAGCAVVTAAKLSLEGVALTFALVIGILVYALGHISGGQFNPAVSVGLAVGGQQSWLRAATYSLAQCLGAIAGAGALGLVLGKTISGVTNPAGSTSESLAMEAVFTFVLMLVVAGVATDPRAPRAAAGLAIGGAIALGGLVAGPVSGGSFNPARSLGPALVTGDLVNLWIYVAAPLAGAIAAAVLYRYLRGAIQDA